MISTILVALDGSDRALGVFDAAAQVALRFQSVLHLFRAVFVPPEFPAAASGSRHDPLPNYLTNEALQALGAVAARAKGVAIGAPIVRIGQPWRLILQVSDAIDADLIVIGSHGYHGLDHILGTTAARVANLARRDVLVVHEGSASRAGRPIPPAPYR